MSNSTGRKNMNNTDYEIPTFSMKSAFIILLGAIFGTLVFPYLLNLFGVNLKLGVILGNAIFSSFALAYVRFFIESGKGFCVGFWVTYGGFSLAFAIISYFWLYLDSYI